ncbi:MAG: hypothetical protein ACI8W7_001142 [Gammaproteobacteria bacterium]|jgi:hypothetical protein
MSRTSSTFTAAGHAVAQVARKSNVHSSDELENETKISPTHQNPNR